MNLNPELDSGFTIHNDFSSRYALENDYALENELQEHSMTGLADDKTIPVWNNRHIYTGFDDSAMHQDIQTIDRMIASITDLADSLEPSASEIETASVLSKAVNLQEDVTKKIWTISVFANSVNSVDVKDSDASKLIVKAGDMSSRLRQAYMPVNTWLLRASDEFMTTFFENSEMKKVEYRIRHARERSVHLLTTGEEVVVAGLANDGLHAWGRLYSELSGSLSCEIEGKKMGLASVSNLLMQSDGKKRREAWEAIQGAWKSREETAAAILNAINGWRHAENKQRSREKHVHYLDVTSHGQAIERETLNALMESTAERKSIGHRAVASMAKMLEVDRLGPQDLLAPCPPQDNEPGRYYVFEQAIDLVADAFTRFDPEMGEFAHRMYQKGWIDAKPTENRKTGAYCTKFANVREPRVFMTWDGSAKNVITLAHELGHAWHNWVMKDLALNEIYYPSTLAETASIFAETLVRDALYDQAESDAERMAIAWQDAASSAAFLLNIPARFEFEQRMVEAREQGYLPAAELSEMMEESWAKWYEDSISEYDPMFWACKLHFSISGMSFYNYPYLFGYLFSLGIYAQKDKMAGSFRDTYIALLRDTGTMTAEDLVMKHLGQDIRKPEFWNASLDIVEGLVSRFEGLLQKK